MPCAPSSSGLQRRRACDTSGTGSPALTATPVRTTPSGASLPGNHMALRAPVVDQGLRSGSPGRRARRASSLSFIGADRAEGALDARSRCSATKAVLQLLDQALRGAAADRMLTLHAITRP